MGFFRFLGRHILASIIGAIGVILAALGYADQARDILTGFEPWQLQASGAGLFVVAVVMILYRWDQQQAERSTREAAPVLAPPSTPPAPLLTPSPPPSSKREIKPIIPKHRERIYVGKNITPKVLTEMFKGKTTHQGNRIVAPFIGKWMRVTGVLEDFAMLSDKLGQVTFRRPELVKIGDISLDDLSCTIRLYFRKGFDRLEILQGGEVLTVDGEIERIDAAGVSLEKCELVAVENA